MKRLHLIFLTLFLLLGQLGSLDHVYHEHESGEVCDYCLGAQSLDHAVTVSHTSVTPISISQSLHELTHEFFPGKTSRYYAARAPPRFI